MTVRLTAAQHEWLIREAAQRALETGERHDVSGTIRELIDRAIAG